MRNSTRKACPFQEIGDAYFEIKGPTLKGIVTDKNRYQNHLLPLCGKRTVNEITPQVIEELRKSLSGRKPATVWNALELLRRIVNFGYKTNRCPALSFQIEMPSKDNEVIEYLKPEEAQRFLAVLKEWPVRDVANMLLLAFFTGMRRGEMFKLEVGDLDFHMKLIRHFSRHYRQNEGSGNAPPIPVVRAWGDEILWPLFDSGGYIVRTSFFV